MFLSRVSMIILLLATESLTKCVSADIFFAIYSSFIRYKYKSKANKRLTANMTYYRYILHNCKIWLAVSRNLLSVLFIWYRLPYFRLRNDIIRFYLWTDLSNDGIIYQIEKLHAVHSISYTQIHSAYALQRGADLINIDLQYADSISQQQKNAFGDLILFLIQLVCHVFVKASISANARIDDDVWQILKLAATLLVGWLRCSRFSALEWSCFAVRFARRDGDELASLRPIPWLLLTRAKQCVHDDFDDIQSDGHKEYNPPRAYRLLFDMKESEAF